jgi:penicillin-binding protein 2
LTIDLRIQKAAEKALLSHGQNTKGAIVVMDIRNGDVLAMASSPPFDPNLFVPRISPEEWMKLTDTNLNIALNRATYATYAPGSIFKVAIGLAALEFGNLNPKEIYHSKGIFSYGPRSRPVRDTASAGDYDFRRAIVKSSNSYFINYGLETGLDAIMEIANRLCLGQKTGIPLRQESSGFVPTPAWVERRNSQGDPVQIGDIGQLCIGQGAVAVTPLQMTVMVASVANGGKVLWPRLVERILPPGPVAFLHDGQGIYFPPRGVRSELRVKPQHIDTLKTAMLADVEDIKEGTGRPAMVPGFRICGKTGTAQVIKGGRVVRLDTWFASFAPYENPRYAMVVFIEGGVSGGGTCGPLARMVYETIKDLETPKPLPAVGQDYQPAGQDSMLAQMHNPSLAEEY